MYKTEVITSTPNLIKRSQKVEEKINTMAKQGYEFISLCSTPNFGIIMVFKK